MIRVDLFSRGGLGAFAYGETGIAVDGFPFGEFRVADGGKVG